MAGWSPSLSCHTFEFDPQKDLQESRGNPRGSGWAFSKLPWKLSVLNWLFLTMFSEQGEKKKISCFYAKENRLNIKFPQTLFSIIWNPILRKVCITEFFAVFSILPFWPNRPKSNKSTWFIWGFIKVSKFQNEFMK